MQVPQARHFYRGLTIAAGALIAVTLGLICLHYSFAGPLVRLSYDLPFLWRTTLDTHDIRIVYLDEYSAKELNQPLDDVWNRALHVSLLDRLTREQARLVLYDIVFDAPRDPEADAAFAQAIHRNGKVILGAALEINERQGIILEHVALPIKPLRKAALGYGVLAFKPVDSDYGVRQIYLGTGLVSTATWKAGEMLGAPITHQDRQSLGPIWVNYYGPRNTFSAVGLAQALLPNGVPPGYFRDKIVLVGGQLAVGVLRVGRDEFASPYSRSHHQFTPGTEVHATILLNLLRGQWLTRMPINRESLLVIVMGLIAGGLAFFRPTLASLIAILLSFGLVCAACWLVWHQRIWFSWVIPSMIQLPLGLTWSVGAQYLLESRRRKELRRAFAFYLSPEMADLIADSDFDLHPGGKVVEATVIFTDLENFTTISENLDPAEASALLIAYFEQTTQCILKNKGTIIKYVGDAVLAAWGAPVEEPAHAIRAADAACDLRCLAEMNVRGKRLRTRVGVNSGKVLAGNLGSSFRFDYTMIGDTVNFASRLESLNKYLSTQVLISDSVQQQLDGGFITRRLGEFRVAGKTKTVLIHELICRCQKENGERVWIDAFETGLDAFRAGRFSEAAALMDRTQSLRQGRDGPAEFYLRKIAKLRGTRPSANWTGIVEFSEK